METLRPACRQCCRCLCKGKIESGCRLDAPEQGHLGAPSPSCPECVELVARQCLCPRHGLHKKLALHPAQNLTQAGYVLSVWLTSRCTDKRELSDHAVLFSMMCVDTVIHAGMHLLTYLWAVAFSQLYLGCAALSYVHCGDQYDLPITAVLRTSCSWFP